jgi:glycogen(starch) synthase
VRVLTISNMYPPHHYGGYELSCRDVMDRFEDNGHDVTVLTTSMRVPGVDDAPGEDSARVRRELDFYWRDHVLQSPSLPRRVRVERSNQQALRRAVRDVRPDVVSVWNMGAMSLGLLTTLAGERVPIVYNVCDDWLDYGPHLDAWTRLFTARPRLGALAARVTGVPTSVPELGPTGTFCFVSERTRRHAEERTGARFPRSTIVYSGVDGRDFPRPEVSSIGGEWSWRLLFVGRIDERKGIETLVRALPLLPAEATVELLGQGDAGEVARLRTIADELGVARRVSFGSCDRAELSARYTAADAVVFPSTWDEPFGLVPVEAMACATPVVASGTGGSAEFLVDRVNCLLFRAGDETALAEALRLLAGDARLRASLIAGGLATADDLTVDRLADTLETWHHAAATGFADGEPPHRPRPGRG